MTALGWRPGESQEQDDPDVGGQVWLGFGALASLVALTGLAVALLIPASFAGQSTADVGWSSVNGMLDGQRYSPLTQIDTSSVKGLKVAWSFRAKTLGSESYPVVIGRTAYVTTSFGNVYALDAVTGEKLWSANVGKQKNIGLAAFAAVHGFPNRGVAVGEGHVFVMTPNALLLSLNQRTGRQ
jgi:alcohol dehydrogenase (cytochrome c)